MCILKANHHLVPNLTCDFKQTTPFPKTQPNSLLAFSRFQYFIIIMIIIVVVIISPHFKWTVKLNNLVLNVNALQTTLEGTVF